MANTLITPSVIAKEAVMALENNLVMANLVHRDFSAEFQKVGATVTVRKPATFTATAFSTTVAAQNISESSVQVVLDKHYDITAEITSQQLSLDIADFSQQVLQPMMREHAQKVDANILNTVYSGLAGHTPVSSTPTLGDLANLMVQLDIQKAPVTERRVVLHPITYAKYAVLDPIANADKHGTPLTINEYSIGRLLGADWYMDQNVPIWTSGIVDAAGTLSGGASAGATAVTVAALTNGETVAAGDVFKIAGSDRGYLVLTGGVVSSSSVAITFTPPLDTGISTGAVVTSNAQAALIAAAIISRLEISAQQGGASVPVNCGAELYDYVKVTDARENDYRAGNFGSITRTYRNYPGQQPEYSMIFYFGQVAAKSVPGARASSLVALGITPRNTDSSIPWDELWRWMQQTDAYVKTTMIALGFLEGELQVEYPEVDLEGYLQNVVEDTTPQLGGELDANSKKISGLATPTANYDAATKKYVDDNSGISDIVEDSSPQLGGDLDLNEKIIKSLSGNINMDGKTGYVFKVDGVSGITFDQYGIILKGSYLTIKKTDGTQAATITVETDGTLKITPAAGEQVTIASNLAVSGGIGASGDIISSQSIGGEVGVICPTYPDGDPIQGSIRVSNLVFYWYSGGAWHFAVEN